MQLLLECLRTGDTLMVTRMDRLARSIKDLQDIVYTLTQQGVTLRATEQPVNTRSAAGKASLSRYNAQRHRSEKHSRLEDWLTNIPRYGVRDMCSWELLVRDPSRRPFVCNGLCSR